MASIDLGHASHDGGVLTSNWGDFYGNKRDDFGKPHLRTYTGPQAEKVTLHALPSTLSVAALGTSGSAADAATHSVRFPLRSSTRVIHKS